VHALYMRSLCMLCSGLRGSGEPFWKTAARASPLALVTDYHAESRGYGEVQSVEFLPCSVKPLL